MTGTVDKLSTTGTTKSHGNAQRLAKTTWA